MLGSSLELHEADTCILERMSKITACRCRSFYPDYLNGAAYHMTPSAEVTVTQSISLSVTVHNADDIHCLRLHGHSSCSFGSIDAAR